MGYKKIEYTHKNISQLKSENRYRILFAIFFLLVLTAQIVLFIIEGQKLSNIKYFIGFFVMISSFLMATTSILYFLKNNRIITQILTEASAVRMSANFLNTDKSYVLKLYAVFNIILTALSSIILLCSLVYTFLEFAYYSNLTFFLPILLLICISGYNTVFHIKYEILTAENVDKYFERF